MYVVPQLRGGLSQDQLASHGTTKAKSETEVQVSTSASSGLSFRNTSLSFGLKAVLHCRTVETGLHKPRFTLSSSYDTPGSLQQGWPNHLHQLDTDLRFTVATATRITTVEHTSRVVRQKVAAANRALARRLRIKCTRDIDPADRIPAAPCSLVGTKYRYL